MPSTVEALVVLVLFVVPGFLFRRGYLRARPRAKAEPGLYALAEAVVFSLVLIAATWWWRGADVVAWAEQETAVTDHSGETFTYLVALLLLSFPVGVVIGLVVDWLEERWDSWVLKRKGDDSAITRLVRRVEGLGVTLAPTVWDETWDRLTSRGQTLYVRVRTTTGNEIVGVFSEGSVVTRSPEEQELYIAEVYRFDERQGVWEKTPGGKGALISGSQVETIEFAEVLEWPRGVEERQPAQIDSSRAGEAEATVAAEEDLAS